MLNTRPVRPEEASLTTAGTVAYTFTTSTSRTVAFRELGPDRWDSGRGRVLAAAVREHGL